MPVFLLGYLRNIDSVFITLFSERWYIMAADVKAIYNLAFSVIDYCNDISKGNGHYSEYFSPNNIRRLIISPDEVVSEFYITVPGVGSKKSRRISSMQLRELSMMPDYQPIVQVLSTDRVCSSIEEIVFLPMSNDGRFPLSPIEYNIASLIKGYTGGRMDCFDAVKKRFVRLRYITVVNATMNQFQSLERTRKDMVAEHPALTGRVNVTTVHDESDWYHHWGSPAAAKSYPSMDGVGGHLHKFFSEQIEAVDKRLKKSAVDAVKTERIKGVVDDFTKEFDKMKCINKYVKKMEEVLKHFPVVDGVSCLSSASFGGANAVKLPFLYECGELGNYPCVLPQSGSVAGKDLYLKNTELARAYCRECTEYFSRMFLISLSEYNKSFPATLKMLANSDGFIKTDVIPADGYSGVAGLQFTGKNMLRSCANCCYNMCLVLIDYTHPYNQNKPSNKLKEQFTNYESWKSIGRVN